MADQGVDPSEEKPKEEEEEPKKIWSGWGMSAALSAFADIQKVASVAAEEISKNVAKGINELQSQLVEEEPESNKGELEVDGSGVAKEKEVDVEEENMRKLALEKLEKASEESILSQGLKVLDTSVENITVGAWQALGSALKGGSTLVHKLETSAVTLADTIQQGALQKTAPSLLETGKALTTRGIQVLEFVGKETMDLLINETGFEVEKDAKANEVEIDEEQFSEEATFDRCFYIYGGPEQLEELEALSSHHALLFGRRKTKLSAEQKSSYEGQLKEVQRIFTLTELDCADADSNKGKTVESAELDDGNEMKTLCESSVSRAAEMAAGFGAALEGLAANEIVNSTTDRLEGLHSEGVHRLSELCCLGVSHLLVLGKSLITSVNKSKDDEIEESDSLKIDWPDELVSKAKIIRLKAQLMTGDVMEVSNSFITGVSDVLEAYLAAMKKVANDSSSTPNVQVNAIQDKARVITDNLINDKKIAISKFQDGLQYLAHVVLSTSMPTAV